MDEEIKVFKQYCTNYHVSYLNTSLKPTNILGDKPYDNSFIHKHLCYFDQYDFTVSQELLTYFPQLILNKDNAIKELADKEKSLTQVTDKYRGLPRQKDSKSERESLKIEMNNLMEAVKLCQRNITEA